MSQQTASEEARIALPGRLVLVLVAALSSIGFASLAPVLPQISQHFAEVPGATAIVRAMITAAGAAMAVGGPIAGLLAARFGERRVLLAALALFLVAGVSGYVIDNIWLLLASRILVGLALTSTGICALAMLANGIEAGQRNRWMGYFAVSASVGAVAIMPAAAALGEMNWRLVFLLNLLVIPIAIGVLTAVPDLPRAAADPDAASGGKKGFPLTLLLIGMACGAFGATLPAFIPFHLVAIGESNPRNVATAIICLTIAAASASFLYGAVRRRLDIRQVFIAGFAISTAAVALFGLAPTLIGAFAGMFLVGCASGLFGPNLSALGAAAPPDQRAWRIGLARGGFYGAPLVAQIPLEPISAQFGVGGALWTLCGFAACMAVVTLLMRRLGQ